MQLSLNSRHIILYSLQWCLVSTNHLPLCSCSFFGLSSRGWLQGWRNEGLAPFCFSFASCSWESTRMLLTWQQHLFLLFPWWRLNPACRFQCLRASIIFRLSGTNISQCPVLRVRGPAPGLHSKPKRQRTSWLRSSLFPHLVLRMFSGPRLLALHAWNWGKSHFIWILRVKAPQEDWRTWEHSDYLLISHKTVFVGQTLSSGLSGEPVAASKLRSSTVKLLSSSLTGVSWQHLPLSSKN